MPHNHLNQLGIFRETRLKYYLPILPERVGIVLGQHHRNRKKIADMFKCTISFLSNNIYNYPIFIIQSDDEINIWDAINYIQYIVTIPIKTKYTTIDTIFTNYLKEIDLFYYCDPVGDTIDVCYCDDDWDSDTFEFCRYCQKKYG